MAVRLDLHGLFENNSTFDYSDYEYKSDCTRTTSFVAIFVSILYSVALVLGLVGNILVLVVLWQKRRSWSVTDAFVLHLSMADMLLLLTVPVWAADAVQGWSFGTGFCKLAGALFKINFCCSIFLLVCIGLDLYFSVVHAGQMCSRTRPWQVQLICLAVWFFCLLLSIPDWMYLKAASGSEPEDYTECVYEYPSEASRLASQLLYLMLGFLLPAIVLLCCYACVLPQFRSDQRVQKKRAVILALVLAFFISWTPYSIALLSDTFHFSSNKSKGDCEDRRWTAVRSTAVLGFLHSCSNPLIYFCFSEKFRHWVLTIVKCGSCAVDSGDFFPWDSREIEEATSVPQEEKGPLHQMNDIERSTPQQKNGEIL
ncbi:C-X-C chemokine receptor type 3 [Pangasianodon hypophthalmus]|uniref:C-X-C chemokine receptor type 3 n=1 Tax=Pangasianodon hypophthalmus TaxID=310915 RepID=UPI0023071528|nr:C-X-C chemokine receptor type 3 [Pangasianodon hypophthalmus]